MNKVLSAPFPLEPTDQMIDNFKLLDRQAGIWYKEKALIIALVTLEG